MMKSATGYIIICMILLTALIGLIILLIIVTEQPDLIFGDEPSGKLYSRIPPDSWSNPAVSTSGPTITYFTQEDIFSTLTTSPIPSAKFDESRPLIVSGTNISVVNSIPVVPVRHHSKSSMPENSININPASRSVYLHKTFEIASKNNSNSNLVADKSSKYVGILSTNQEKFYLPKLNGEIETWKSVDKTNFELVNTIETNYPINKLKFLTAANTSFLALAYDNGKEAVVNNLYVFDLNGNKISEKNISAAAKDMAVFNDQIYLLDRFNNTIHVYSGELEFIRSIEYENTRRETCNFIHATKEHILVSCQSAILQFSATGNGSLVQQYGIPEGSYSLPIQLPSPKSLMAVQRGREEIHVFDYENNPAHLKAKLVHNEDNRKQQTISIWSALELLQNSTVLITLEHISNTVQLFSIPESSQTIF